MRSAQAQFAGCPDLLLLVVDPDESREPLPACSVLSVRPFAATDGVFELPEPLPVRSDTLGRVGLAEHHAAWRRAATRVEVRGGFATLDDRIPHSFEHNALRLRSPGPVEEVLTDAARVFGAAGRAHWRIAIDHPCGAPLASDLATRGWEVTAYRLLAWSPDTDRARPEVSEGPFARELSRVEAEDLVHSAWLEGSLQLTDEQLRQLVVRDRLDQAWVLPFGIGVVDRGGRTMAGLRLEIDGGCAEITSVLTLEAARRRGLAGASIREALRRALEHGCDRVWLTADADDWVADYYVRLGFVDLNWTTWSAQRPVLDSPSSQARSAGSCRDRV